VALVDALTGPVGMGLLTNDIEHDYNLDGRVLTCKLQGGRRARSVRADQIAGRRGMPSSKSGEQGRFDM
jgi:hypothetical protein